MRAPLDEPTRSSQTSGGRATLSANQQPGNNFARVAVARARQQGSQTVNLRQKSVGQSPSSNFRPSLAYNSQQEQQQQQFDSEAEEPQQQQQQQQQTSLDDSSVQTSTSSAQTANYSPTRQPNNRPNQNQNQNQNQNYNNQATQQQQQPQMQLVVQSGGGPDGSSAISTQYDTLQPAGSPIQQQQRDFDDPPQAQQQQLTPVGNAETENNYESSLSDSSDAANDDFRSAGAKAAASQHQNWYIMRSI